MIFCSVCLTLSSCEDCISLSLYGSPSTLDIDWKHKLTRKSRTTVKNTFPFTHTHILNFFMVCVRQVAAWTAPSLLLSQMSRCCTVPASGRYTCMHLVTYQGRGYCRLHTVYTIHLHACYMACLGKRERLFTPPHCIKKAKANNTCKTKIIFLAN